MKLQPHAFKPVLFSLAQKLLLLVGDDCLLYLRQIIPLGHRWHFPLTVPPVQSFRKVITAHRAEVELICCQSFETRRAKLNASRDININSAADWVWLRKEGCETMPCKSDHTDTTSQPGQNQLCAKWLITTSLKYSRSSCLLLGWKKKCNAEIWLSGFCSFYTLLIK